MKFRYLGVALALSSTACGKKTPPPEATKPATQAPATTKPPETKAPETKPPETVPAGADAGAAPSDDAAAPAPEVAEAETTAATPEAALVDAGKRIAAMSGCPLCHTSFGPTGPDLSKVWAGGLEVPDVVGTWRSPNITQDKKTGIGGWTDEQIAAAVREGVRPDGSHLYPVMPYPFYNRMTDADVKALVAYLRTIAPIENVVAGNTDLKVPKLEVPKPTNAPVADDAAHRGEYFATLAHCSACHTPFAADGKGFDMAKAYAGGQVLEMPAFFDGTLYASNITSDPKTGIGAWTDAELTAVFRSGKKKDGAALIGPMAMYVPAWQQLGDADIADLVTYVKSIPAIENQVPKSTAKPKGPPPEAPKQPEAPKDPEAPKAPDAPKPG